MKTNKQLLIGGQALVKLGSTRATQDSYYLVNDTSTKVAFIHDKQSNTDYCNANGSKFFAAIWKWNKKTAEKSQAGRRCLN